MSEFFQNFFRISALGRGYACITSYPLSQENSFERWWTVTMLPSSDTRSPLSPYRAFVVWLQAETALEPGRWVGWVEHVVSGEATRFETLEELLAFMAWVLAQVQARYPDEP